jgi:hypothetical protein
MIIYQKKIVKDFIITEDCIQTKSTYPNTKRDIDSDFHSIINIHQFYGINSKKNKGKMRKVNSDRHTMSRSQIIINNDIIEKYMPKTIKTVLIKFTKPLEQSHKSNYINDLNYKTYNSTNSYNNQFTNNNKFNDLKVSEINDPYNQEIKINRRSSFDKNIMSTNLYSVYAINKDDNFNKRTRNKSVNLKNKDSIYNTINSMKNGSNKIYRKSFCLDKHKNFGRNFNKNARAKTNPKSKPIKIFKKQLIRNISSPDIYNLINLEKFQTRNNPITEREFINGYDHYLNTNTYKNLYKYRNYNSVNNFYSNEAKSINIHDNYNTQDNNYTNKVKMNSNLKKYYNYKNKRNKEDIEIEISRKNEEFSLKYKVPRLNLRKKSASFSNINNNAINNIKNMNKNKSSKLKQHKKEKSSKKKHNNNLLNRINISKRESKKTTINYEQKKCEKYKIFTYRNKLEKKSKKKSLSKNKSSKCKKQKTNYSKSKNKGKSFRSKNTKKINTENIGFNINKDIKSIKSIPLKLTSLNNINITDKCISSLNDNIRNRIRNPIASNIVFINKKNFELWNDLIRIYKKNGKYH